MTVSFVQLHRCRFISVVVSHFPIEDFTLLFSVEIFQPSLFIGLFTSDLLGLNYKVSILKIEVKGFFVADP